MPEPLAPSAGRVPWRRRGRVEVHDDSMRPTLEPGDRLRIDTGAYRDHGPSVGEIVVLRDPERPDRWLVKRVAREDGDRVFVVGDLGGPSRDSRTFGPVARTAIVGRVVERYAPHDRRRRF